MLLSPLAFHLQVGSVAQEYYAQLLPRFAGIKLRHDAAHTLTGEARKWFGAPFSKCADHSLLCSFAW
jgi:hypothetical protein